MHRWNVPHQLSAEGSGHLNTAIRKLMVILEILTYAPDNKSKQSAILLCLIDLGTIINNGQYKLFSDQFIADHEIIPWNRLRDIRNYLLHHYYHEITPAALGNNFYADILHLCYVLKSLVPPESQQNDIDYTNPYTDKKIGSNVIKYKTYFLKDLHDQISTDKTVEVGLLQRLLIVESKIADIKNLLALNFGPEEAISRMAVLMAMDLDVLLIGQILTDLQRGEGILSAGFQHIVVSLRARGGNTVGNAELMSKLIAMPEARNRRAHSRRGVQINQIAVRSFASTVVLFYPAVLETLHRYGVNVYAILTARMGGLQFASQQGDRSKEIMLIDVNRCLRIVNDLPTFPPIIKLAFFDNIARLAIEAAVSLHLVAPAEQIYRDSYHQLSTACKRPETAEYIKVRQLAKQYAGYDEQLVKHYLTQAIHHFCDEEATHIRDQKMMPILQTFPNIAVGIAMTMATNQLLTQRWIEQIIDSTEAQAIFKMNATAKQWGLAVQYIPIDRQACLNACVQAVYLNAYKTENQREPPETWLSDILQYTQLPTLMDLESSPLALIAPFTAYKSAFTHPAAATAISASIDSPVLSEDETAQAAASFSTHALILPKMSETSAEARKRVKPDDTETALSEPSQEDENQVESTTQADLDHAERPPSVNKQNPTSPRGRKR